MDWKLFGTTFVALFVAELGDKTQLAAMSLSAGSSQRVTVFVASALALVCTSALAVFAGHLVSRAIPPSWIRRGAGLLFIGIGLGFLLWRGQPPRA